MSFTFSGRQMDQQASKLQQRHSANFTAMALENGRFRRMQHPDGYAKCSRDCGDTLEIYLMSRNGKIRSASFYTEGCLYTIVCANAVLNMAEGKSIAQARAISPRQVCDFLETLPKTERHCAELAVRTLRSALTDLVKTSSQPWKKLYRDV